MITHRHEPGPSNVWNPQFDRLDHFGDVCVRCQSTAAHRSRRSLVWQRFRLRKRLRIIRTGMDRGSHEAWIDGAGLL